MTLFVICDSALPGRNDGMARGIVCRLVFIFVTPPSYGHLPYILHGKTPRKATGHGREEVLNTTPMMSFQSLAILRKEYEISSNATIQQGEKIKMVIPISTQG